jgi:hypothetical protein
MLFHRWGTIIEILASTRLFSKHHKYRDSKMTIKEVIDLVKEMELEKDSAAMIAPGNMLDSHVTITTTNSLDEYEDEDDGEETGRETEPDPDYEADILPEPQIDYFEHPAVRKSSLPHQNQMFHQSFAMNNFMTPMNHPHESVMLHENAGQVLMHRDGHLKPLQSLDARVIKQFRALEQKDPRFKRKILKGKQLTTGRVNNLTQRIKSPGGNDYNYNQI